MWNTFRYTYFLRMFRTHASTQLVFASYIHKKHIDAFAHKKSASVFVLQQQVLSQGTYIYESTLLPVSFFTVHVAGYCCCRSQERASTEDAGTKSQCCEAS